MEKLDDIQSELLAMVQKGQNGENKIPKEISKLPQLPPVVLQKIALMLNDGGARLEFRDSIRFASVNRQMKVAVLGSIDRMQRRRVVSIVLHTYDAFKVNLTVKNQHRVGYTPTECINALMAFDRPNDIVIYFDYELPHQPLLNDCMVVTELMLAAIPPSSILRFELTVMVVEFDKTSLFYGMMTSIGKMVNLEWLEVTCFFDGDHASAAKHLAISPSVPPGSPFLQLLKLEKLRTHRLWASPLTTAAQRADLINRSPSNIGHICCNVHNLNDLMPSLNDSVRAKITKICSVDDRRRLLRGDRELFDVVPSLFERLPLCTDVSALYFNQIRDRGTIDQIGGRLLVSVLALGHSKKLTVRLGVFPDAFKPYVSAGGRTAFTYEHKSIVIKILL